MDSSFLLSEVVIEINFRRLLWSLFYIGKNRVWSKAFAQCSA